MKGWTVICFEFVACYFALIQIFCDICTFFFPLLPRVMSHLEQNPCLTKQLDQKPPVMQQGSDAPLPTAAVRNGGGEGKGRCLDGRGKGSEKAVEEGGLRETGA